METETRALDEQVSTVTGELPMISLPAGEEAWLVMVPSGAMWAFRSAGRGWEHELVAAADDTDLASALPEAGKEPSDG